MWLCLIEDCERGYPRSVLSRFTTLFGAERLRRIIDEKVVMLLKRNARAAASICPTRRPSCHSTQNEPPFRGVPRALESCGAVISQTVNQYSEAEVELLNNLYQWFGSMSFTVDDAQKHTLCSSSSVRAKLARLREKGALSVVQGGGRSRKNRYNLNDFEESLFLSELQMLERSRVQEVVQSWEERLMEVNLCQNLAHA